MGEATNSPRGRAIRPPKSSRRRGSTIYDRLEEARLRRQAVLVSKKVAGASTTEVERAVFRSETDIVKSIASGPTDEEDDANSTEASLCSPAAIEGDAVALETASRFKPEQVLGPSWRLILPGIALGFLVAIGVIGWTSSTLGLTTWVAEENSLDLGQEAPGAFTANPGRNAASEKGPRATHQITALVGFVPVARNQTQPYPTNWEPFIGSVSPAQIVPATVELPPLFDVMPPARQLGPPIVLSAVPPIRPNTAEPTATVTPVFPGLDIVLHVPSRARERDAQTLIAAATDAGFDIAKARPAAFSISQTNIRYFHERDAAAAQALASAVGGRLRDFTDFRPPPDPGVIEVWLKGRGTSARNQRGASARSGIFRDLRAGLRRVFRRGGG